MSLADHPSLQGFEIPLRLIWFLSHQIQAKFQTLVPSIFQNYLKNGDISRFRETGIPTPDSNHRTADRINVKNIICSKINLEKTNERTAENQLI